MEIMYTPDGKPILIDYVRDKESFADIEYKKWLEERDNEKENHQHVQTKQKHLAQS